MYSEHIYFKALPLVSTKDNCSTLMSIKLGQCELGTPGDTILSASGTKIIKTTVQKMEAFH